jgi:calcineurin-like phosphoesterase family protein
MIVWITSDWHLYHQNILKYCDRPFADVKEMNDTIIKNINDVVKKDDLLINLGDVAFCGSNLLQKELEKINCKNKLLILGNHDRERSVKKWIELGFENVSRFPIIYDGFYILSHEPTFLEANSVFFNIYGHLHQHFYTSPNDNYANCCVDVTDFKPIAWERLKQDIENKQKPVFDLAID